jgi:hypothetical protein
LAGQRHALAVFRPLHRWAAAEQEGLIEEGGAPGFDRVDASLVADRDADHATRAAAFKMVEDVAIRVCSARLVE